jgi:hypothetical protein
VPVDYRWSVSPEPQSVYRFFGYPHPRRTITAQQFPSHETTRIHHERDDAFRSPFWTRGCAGHADAFHVQGCASVLRDSARLEDLTRLGLIGAGVPDVALGARAVRGRVTLSGCILLSAQARASLPVALGGLGAGGSGASVSSRDLWPAGSPDGAGYATPPGSPLRRGSPSPPGSPGSPDRAILAAVDRRVLELEDLALQVLELVAAPEVAHEPQA